MRTLKAVVRYEELGIVLVEQNVELALSNASLWSGLGGAASPGCGVVARL